MASGVHVGTTPLPQQHASWGPRMVSHTAALTQDSPNRSLFPWLWVPVPTALHFAPPKLCSMLQKTAVNLKKPLWHSNSNSYSGFPGNTIFWVSKDL